MSWFDEQIRERKIRDEEVFAEAISDMATSLLGRRIAQSIDENRITNDAIDEILKYFRVKMPEIPDKVETLTDKLEFVLRPHGIMRRKVRLTGEWYKDAVGPMMGAIKESGEPVALIPGKYGGYRYSDSKTGRLEKVDSKTAELISSDEVYVFYKPFPLRQITIKDILAYITSTLSTGNVIAVIMTSLVAVLIGMAGPSITHILIDNVVSSGNISLLMAAAILLSAISIGTVLLNTIKTLIVDSISVRMNNAVNCASMMRVLSLPADFFRDHSAGELSQIIGQVNTLCTSIVDMVFTTGLTSIFSICYIFQVFHYAPALCAPAVIIILLTLIISLVATFAKMQVSKKRLEAAMKEAGVTYELISGVQKIRLAGAEKRAFAKWGRAYAPLAKVSFNPPLIVKIGEVLSGAVSIIGTIVLYYVAVKANVSVANYYAFDVAYGLTLSAIMSFVGLSEVAAGIKPILELVKPIFDAVPEVSTGRSVITSLSGGIEINNLSFKYEKDGPNIIDGLNLKIKSGQYIAIVGKTGCGKSTLVRLLLGFEKPDKGAIYYDGKDLKNIDAKSLRRNMGVVIQNGQIFSGELYQNILISSPHPTMDDAWEAAEIAQLADDIRNMPMGMNTYLTEGAGGISGGQKQRVLIARAVAHKPKILIFDEATSALDNITQKQVTKALDELKCTRIVIAHRLSTVKNCDRILVLDKGKIIEDGTYDELISNNGYFADLVERQRLDT